MIAILAILGGLSLVAIQASREAARRAACASNLHQLATAMRMYVELHKEPPSPAPPDSAGGWTVALLPYLEEQALADELAVHSSLVPPNVSPLVRKRLPIMTCPAVVEDPSDQSAIPRAHYAFHYQGMFRKVFIWRLFDVPLDARIPWIAGPQMDLPAENGPHAGMFMVDGDRYP